MFSSAYCRYAKWNSSVYSVNAISIRRYILWVRKCLTRRAVSTLLQSSQQYCTVQKGWNLEGHSWHYFYKQAIFYLSTLHGHTGQMFSVLTFWRLKLICFIKDANSTPNRTHCASIRKPNQLQSCREVNSVNYNKLSEHMTRLSGLNPNFWLRSIYNTALVLKD